MGEIVFIDVSVDLNDAPLLSSLTIPALPLSRLIEVEFEGSDSEADGIQVVFRYVVGSEWFQVGPEAIVVNRQGEGFSGVISWDTFAEFGYGEFPSVAIQLSVADFDTTFLDTVVTIRNLAGDYDGDGHISAPDLALFTSLWVDESAEADLGPAVGDLPLLIPVEDGELDFEDLLVVAQMWNWSVGIVTDQVAGKVVGQEELTYTELIQEDGVLRVLVHPQGALSGDVIIHLDGSDAHVESPQSLVVERRSGSVLEAFAGALDGSTVQDLLAVTVENPRSVNGETRVWNADGSLRASEAWSFALPQTTALTGSWPNPFNSSTTIGFDLSQGALVKLDVFDVLGRRVRSLLSTPLSAGGHRTAWDGRSDEGHSVGTGVYLVRLVANDVVSLHRIMLLK